MRLDVETPSHRARGLIDKTLLGLLCGSLGFGASQLTVISDVRVHANEIGNIRSAFADERKRTDDRIFQVVEQMKEHIRINTALLRQTEEIVAQNERYLAILAAQIKSP